MTAENAAEKDLTAQRGNPVAVITGASSGIGLAAAAQLARHGWALALVGRDRTRLAQAHTMVRGLGQARVEALRCDFAVLSDVRDLAARLLATFPRIDVLANNAGGAIHTRTQTVDGFETTIQVNHLAPFLLTHELLPALRGGRIINTSSRAHHQGRLDPDDLSSRRRRYWALAAYGSAKQANVLFAAEAARRWPDIVSTSFHPGIVRTRFGTGNPLYTFFYRYAPGLRTPEDGARTLVWLATAPRSEVRNGAFYVDEQPRNAATRAADPGLAARLWQASLDATTPTPR